MNKWIYPVLQIRICWILNELILTGKKYNLNSYGERPHRGYTLVDCKQKSIENYRFWYGLISKWLEY